MEPSIEPSVLTAAAEARTNGEIFALYEEHIGTIDPFIAARLTEAEREYPAECIRHAFEEASHQNVRRWAYVEAILKSHKREGCYARRAKEDRRGAALKGDENAALRGPDLGAWKQYAAGN